MIPIISHNAREIAQLLLSFGKLRLEERQLFPQDLIVVDRL